MLFKTLTILAVTGLSLAAISQDEVTSLPGWNKALPSKHYSGHIPVGDINDPVGYLHYWFIECETNPSEAPVIMWLNGGPGSSSLIGLLTENGQFQTNDDSINGSDINLLYNPYSWSQAANVLYLEQPKGVGFSYCAEGKACVNTDESVGQEAADFLERWFAGFSEYKSNDFYITGESYAGIYIPEIMSVIDKRGNITNLKGAAIGDGCWGNEVGTCGYGSQVDRIAVEFYNGHGMFPQPLYTEIKSTCNFSGPESPACEKLLNEMNSNIGNFDIYNIYDSCGNDQATHKDIFKRLAIREFSTSGDQVFATHPQLSEFGGALNDYVCGAEKVMSRWISQESVKKALHVSKKGIQTYRRTAADLRPMYKELAQKYRMLIYSGNVDACVPYWGTEEWTRNIGFPVKQAWKPWSAGSRDEPNSQIQAGYHIVYDAGEYDFTFLTVSGAGHLVPQHKPVQALAMLERFLKNEPF